jgi:DNA-3-methyladenine glycosylase I
MKDHRHKKKRGILGFVGSKPVVNGRASIRELPSCTEVPDALSRDLKQRGFKFVGLRVF